MHERNTVVYTILISLLIYSLLSFASARGRLAELQVSVEEMEKEYSSLLSQNLQLNAALSDCGTPEEMERLARDKLGLVYPREKVFYFLHTDREE